MSKRPHIGLWMQRVDLWIEGVWQKSWICFSAPRSQPWATTAPTDSTERRGTLCIQEATRGTGLILRAWDDSKPTTLPTKGTLLLQDGRAAFCFQWFLFCNSKFVFQNVCHLGPRDVGAVGGFLSFVCSYDFRKNKKCFSRPFTDPCRFPQIPVVLRALTPCGFKFRPWLTCHIGLAVLFLHDLTNWHILHPQSCSNKGFHWSLNWAFLVGISFFVTRKKTECLAAVCHTLLHQTSRERCIIW